MSDAGPGQLGVFQYAQRVGELPLHTVFAVASALALARLSAAKARAIPPARSWRRASGCGRCCGSPPSSRWRAWWRRRRHSPAVRLGAHDRRGQQQITEAMRWILLLLPLQAAQLVLATRLNSHRRIADQVLGYGAGLAALALVWRPAAGHVLARLGGVWRGLGTATAVLWWRLARHQADAQWRNAGVLLAALLVLATAGAALRLMPLPWALDLALAAVLFAAGVWALLRFDPLGRLVRDRYTSRRQRRAA
jgi:hypothetical protein